ncbi:MAG TPA: sigma 54-interacting transcriptional regulator [Bacteroidota bacterium]|nr:sigma 54-interacting transcriptional regulator [Bacteroidota bacterium]
MEPDENEIKESISERIADLAYPIVGKSRSVDQLLRSIQKVSRTTVDVLIVGESGLGKGAVAKDIHALTQNVSGAGASNGGDKSFVSLNLSVLDDKELESLLATGSNHSAYDRLFLGSSKGTVLIEEVEEASFRNQMKLLNFLNERQDWAKSAKGRPEKSTIRFIVTLKESPQALVERRKLLEDLFHLLNSFERIAIPPLRERPEDIPYIVNYFVGELCKEMGIAELSVDLAALDVLVRQSWKENIRELKAIVDKSVLFSTEGKFTLPPELLDEKTEISKMLENIESGQDFILDSSLDIIEKGIIERALNKFGFNQSRAASFLGMTEQTLRYKLKRLGIQHSRQR